MPSTSIWPSYSRPSTPLAPKSVLNSAHRVNEPAYGIVPASELNKRQSARTTRDRAKAKTMYDAINAWARVEGHPEMPGKLKKFGRQLEMATGQDIAQGGQGWMPTQNIGAMLPRKAGRRKARSYKSGMRAVDAFVAMGFAEHEHGRVRWIMPIEANLSTGLANGQICPFDYPQDCTQQADTARISESRSLYSNAEGELPKRERNAKGRFVKASSANESDKQPAPQPAHPSRIDPTPYRDVIPPAPSSEELDALDRELARLTDCLKKRSQNTLRHADQRHCHSEVGSNRLTGGQSVMPAHVEGEPTKPPAPSLTSSDPGVISVDDLGAMAGAAGAEFQAMVLAAKAREPQIEIRRQTAITVPQRKLAPIVSRGTARAQKPLSTELSTPRWLRVERGGRITRDWLADVFGGQPDYQSLSFASIRRLNLDVHSMLAARALVDGCKGIPKNRSGMLVAAAKRLQSGTWRMRTGGGQWNACPSE